MLGYVMAGGRGAADLLIRDVALCLRADGVTLAGAYQVNDETGPARRCRMELCILTGAESVTISQDLGTLSRGCRLDPEGLERAVGLVGAALANGADCLIVNKFGKQEVDGRGFRPLIGEALAGGVPVLTAVNESYLAGFLAFADGMAERLPQDAGEVVAWCRARSLGAV